MKTIVLSLSALLLSVCAFAQGSASDTSAKDPCAVDIKQFCGDITPGQGRIGACLKAHDDKISSGCRDFLTQVGRSMHELRMACRKDVEKFCSDVKVGGGRLLDCLQSHQKDLTAACKTETQTFGARGTASTPPETQPSR